MTDVATLDHVFAHGPSSGWSETDARSEVMDLLESLKPAWWAKASCRRARPDIEFFPEDGSHDRYAADEAKKVCKRCPVWGDCYREHVLEKAESYGVWAGFTKKGAQGERRRLGIKLMGGGGQEW